MSKKSQREARQMKEEIEQQKRSKFLETLDVYLKMFAESLPRNKDLGPMTDLSAAAFDVGLQDLSPEQLKIGCEEILRRATFFPTPGEVRDALNAYLGRQPAASSSWDESLRNLNSQWNRALRYKAWKEKRDGQRSVENGN